ncbi:hypothetical protein PEX1_096490 [Penicillium expansum]|uniref:Uncharacterized protein n=1 Tax=Penicillium expansum TaxID=27334 RepID=A0A0A2JXR2_PENEN|nr:hypothetical protein PEX2_074230 [Penicillium expansum]KGO38653.1 hypothetical protein PEXP_083460 [Penicillium expansum]KGO56022.1 hypothetical protein PEX1_096490 [Penicillium expansum]KGO59443.1 hypothetical protein PEX2_074230 [Penicillium expansum]
MLAYLFIQLLAAPTLVQFGPHNREREREHNITSDTHIPSWGRVAIAKPRSGPLQNTDLRFRISQINAPDLVGPVVSLLLAVEALWQYVGTSASLARITSLDHAGLIDFRARFVEGDPRVVRAMREGLGASLNAVLDATAFAEGLMLVDRCIETMKDETVKAEVGAIAYEDL